MVVVRVQMDHPVRTNSVREASGGRESLILREGYNFVRFKIRGLTALPLAEGNHQTEQNTHAEAAWKM